MKRALVAALLLAGCAAGPDGVEADDAELTADPAFARWAELAKRAGVTVNRGGEATVLGIRGMAISGDTHATRVQRSFDDLVVVLKPNHTIVKLAMATHPFETRNVSGVPDVDGDGVEDVGMIRPGVYRAVGRGTTRLVGSHIAFDVATAAGSGKLPGTRDTNHDGVYSAAEDAASDARGDRITEVLFHHANGGAPPAVGCQVFDEAGIVALVAAVGGPKASFDYALLDVDDLGIGP